MDAPITLTIPDDISARAHEIAAATAQPVEQVLLNHLKTLAIPIPTLPADEQTELDALHALSDDALWTIAAEQMPDAVQARMQTLMDGNSRGRLTPDEYGELEKLVERGDRLMVRKAEAAGILMERGHSFSQADFKTPHE